jgi:hypothetical protein
MYHDLPDERNQPVAGLPAVFCISRQVFRREFLFIEGPPHDGGDEEENEDSPTMNREGYPGA